MCFAIEEGRILPMKIATDILEGRGDGVLGRFSETAEGHVLEVVRVNGLSVDVELAATAEPEDGRIAAA